MKIDLKASCCVLAVVGFVWIAGSAGVPSGNDGTPIFNGHDLTGGPAILQSGS